MSRQFNPVVNAYYSMLITVDEDLSQPVTRVKKHLQAIRERRENINGS
jgi:hypothetical protein